MGKLSRQIVVAQSLALLAALVIVLPVEFDHRFEVLQKMWGPNWVEAFEFHGDSTLPVLLLCLLPYFWFVRRPFWVPSGRWWHSLKSWWCEGPNENERKLDHVVSRGLTIIAASAVALTSLAVSWRVSEQTLRPRSLKAFENVRFDRDEYRFGELPPAYHDEYSYLFQAKTYLAGRLSFPSHPTAARLFDQMHVVNEGRFASRYFPATGLFIAPWLWLEWPIVGHWLAGAATCLFVFGIGFELSNNGTGFVAGMLTALSPGIAIFGGLLLAHHPTLLSLGFFAWSFLRWQTRESLVDVTLAGIGLSCAMLCRPMTAAGFALPFGVVFLMQLFRQQQRSPVKLFLAMAVPLIVGFALLAVQNKAITGSVTNSPYELFNEIYTPSHIYGFNNVVRGKQRVGPRVLENYDRMAVNLNPALAAENSWKRLLASWQWTLGVVPLLVASVIFVLTGHTRDRRWWLVFASVVSLFAAHVPYWFTGIFDWHYVFESGPLWCLLLAAITNTLGQSWLAADRPRMPVWWGLLIGSVVLVNHIEAIPFWYSSKLQAGVEQVAFSRLKYQAFDELLKREVRQRPALVLVEADPSDRHIDYVVNEPSLSAEIIRGRYSVTDWPIERIVAEFPDRHIYLYHAKTGELKSVTRLKAK
ncbi:MAG: hypothetical protein NT013_07945 [Planctomycetia bacterium]|nr:hypothetical protein [Planctomycetia bacterium]